MESSVNYHLSLLVVFQNLTQEISTLQEKVSQIPRDIEKLENDFTGFKQKCEVTKNNLEEVRKIRRRNETRLEDQEQKVADLNSKLYLLKTEKEFNAMKNEIYHFKHSNDRLQDQILELMVKIEDLKETVKQEEKQIIEKKQIFEAEKQQKEQRMADLKSAMEKKIEEKRKIEKRIPSKLLSDYHRIAHRRDGIAISSAEDGICSACNIQLRPQIWSELIGGEKITHCWSCRRILYYEGNLVDVKL